MANSTLLLLQDRLRTRGGHSGPISPQAAVICELIDHWNTLHWNDRNMHGEQVKKLTEELKQLKARLQSVPQG